MIIDISDILSCENKEETKQVQIELTSFISKLGEFPIISVDSVQPLSGGSSDRYPLFD